MRPLTALCATPADGRLALNTALSLLLLAPALIALAPGQPLRRLPPAQVALLASFALGLVTVSGYLVGTIHLDGSANASQPALHSALAILVAALAGLALRPREGLVAPLTAPTATGALLRNLLPPLLIAPLVLGALRYQGERTGLYGRSGAGRRVKRARRGDVRLEPRGGARPLGRHAHRARRPPRPARLRGRALRGDRGGPRSRAAARAPRPAARRHGAPGGDHHLRALGRGAFAFLYDISPRVEARTALESKSAELERSNAELEQFAYVASHDLAEPLRVVSGFAQLLQRRYAGQLDERADTYIEQTVAGTVRMRSLIEDLLAYSRVGRGELNPEDVPLAELVEDARAGQAARIVESGAAVEVLSELPVVRGERGLLGQLVANLVGNALKYAGEAPPRVEVFADEEPDRWRISVRDHGIGIASEYREKVFKMFQRLHTRDEYEGTGIGLAICRRVVERHGGEIGIEDTPGGGATFSFTLLRED